MEELELLARARTVVRPVDGCWGPCAYLARAHRRSRAIASTSLLYLLLDAPDLRLLLLDLAFVSSNLTLQLGLDLLGVRSCNLWIG